MESFTDMEMKNEVIDGGQIALAVSSFFTIALGGLCIGILVGFLTALFTKAQCARNAKKLEPAKAIWRVKELKLSKNGFMWQVQQCF